MATKKAVAKKAYPPERSEVGEAELNAGCGEARREEARGQGRAQGEERAKDEGHREARGREEGSEEVGASCPPPGVVLA